MQKLPPFGSLLHVNDCNQAVLKELEVIMSPSKTSSGGLWKEQGPERLLNCSYSTKPLLF